MDKSPDSDLCLRLGPASRRSFLACLSASIRHGTSAGYSHSDGSRPPSRGSRINPSSESTATASACLASSFRERLRPKTPHDHPRHHHQLSLLSRPHAATSAVLPKPCHFRSAQDLKSEVADVSALCTGLP